MDVDQFLSLADQVCAEFDKSAIENFAVVSRAIESFERLRKAATMLHKDWDVLG